jgi:hypothetical protein
VVRLRVIEELAGAAHRLLEPLLVATLLLVEMEETGLHLLFLVYQ